MSDPMDQPDREQERAEMSGDDPMPVFTIKAKDNLAVHTIDHYKSLCIENGLIEQAAHVKLAIREIMAWQARHTNEVHAPDHKHVPSAQTLEAAVEVGARAVSGLDEAGWARLNPGARQSYRRPIAIAVRAICGGAS